MVQGRLLPADIVRADTVAKAILAESTAEAKARQRVALVKGWPGTQTPVIQAFGPAVIPGFGFAMSVGSPILTLA